MNTKLLYCGLLLSAWGATAAHAADDSKRGFYVAGGVGVASVSDVDITYYDASGTFGGTGAQDTANGTVDLKNAANFDGSIGYDFGMIRADVQVAYAKNKLRALTINSLNGAPVTLSAADRADVCDYLEAGTCGGSGNTFVIDGSRIRQLSALANIWVDVPVGNVVTPYVGGGVGIAGFEIDGEGKGKFAWQLGAGAAVNLGETVAVTLDYRHRQSSRTNVAYDASSGFNVGKIKTNTFSAGLRFTF